MQNQAVVFYKRSGRFDPARLLVAAASVILLGVIAGALYGVLMWVIPIVYFLILGPIAFGVGLGFVAGKQLSWAKTRNLPLAGGCALAGALFGVYGSWVGWIYAASDWDLLLLNPSSIYTIASAITEDGLWEAFGTTPRGAFLVTIWVVEALIIIVGSVWLGLAGVSQHPFSEVANAWADQTQMLPPAKPVRPSRLAEMRDELARGDVSCIAEFEPFDVGSDRFTKFRLNWAEGYKDQELYLSILDMSASYDNNGNLKVKTTPIAEYLLIDDEVQRLIEDILDAGDEELDELSDEEVGHAVDADYDHPYEEERPLA